MNTELLAGLAGGSAGAALWLVLSWPRALVWEAHSRWMGRRISQVARGMRRRLHPHVLIQADVLAWSPRQLFWRSMATAGVLGIGVGFIVGWLWGLIIAGAAFYVAPAWMVRQEFRRYQRALAQAFETHVLLLHIYFELGMPLLTAFRQMRLALRGPAQAQMERLLGDFAQGHPDAALRAWAARTQLMAYRMLADTLIQQRGQVLQGGTLDPLDTLLSAQRTQTMKSQTSKLSSGAAIVPILATLAITLLYLYGLMANIPGLNALHFHF